jgi:hypothetical protein
VLQSAAVRGPRADARRIAGRHRNALAKIAADVARRTKKPMTADEIGVKVGKIINQHKVDKYFELTIEDNLLRFERNEESIARETQTDAF